MEGETGPAGEWVTGFSLKPALCDPQAPPPPHLNLEGLPVRQLVSCCEFLPFASRAVAISHPESCCFVRVPGVSVRFQLKSYRVRKRPQLPPSVH